MPLLFLHTITCGINSNISAENEEIYEEKIGGTVFGPLEADIWWSGSFYLRYETLILLNDSQASTM